MVELAIKPRNLKSRELAKFAKQDRHPVAAYLAELSAGSRRGQFVALRAALAAATGRETAEVGPEEVWARDWSALRHEHVAAIRSALQARASVAYANKTLAAVRGVLKAAWRLGLLDQDTYARAADVRPVRGSVTLAGRDLSAGELAALMQACGGRDADAAGIRDAALIGVGYACGLRIAEAAGLNLEDWELATGCLLVRGKGNKERQVYPRNGALQALRAWLELRGPEPGPLFQPINRRGELEPRHLTDTALRKMLHRRGAAAGLEAYTWHDFRRTLIGDLLDAGVDLALVQRMVGHSDPRTTSRYDRRPEAAKAEASELVAIPYFGPRVK